MFSTVLTEQMEGWLSIHDHKEKQAFVLRLCAPSSPDHPLEKVRSFTGTVALAGEASPISCDGILELSPSGPAYEFRFCHPQDGNLVVSGKKIYATHNLLTSLTLCPLKIYEQNTTEPVGTGEMRYTQPLWHFPLESFKIINSDAINSMTNTFSTTPYPGSQYPDKMGQGHYESWFIRANHPRKPQALWIRYTQFIPAAGNKEQANGELWAIWFDKESSQPPVTGYQAFPLADCSFDKQGINIYLAKNRLTEDALTGDIQQNGRTLNWDLKISRQGGPLLLLPESMYSKGFPKAKSLVLDTHCRFTGILTIDGEDHNLENWRGSLNHNWGKQHTDEYAWGQVAGFDDNEEVFLECATARIKLGPVMSPAFSPVVLKIGHETLRFNQLTTSLWNKGRYSMADTFEWEIQAKNHRARISIQFKGNAGQFATLKYRNPPGGLQTCLNSKIASCTLLLDDQQLGQREFISTHGAAFEILTG